MRKTAGRLVLAVSLTGALVTCGDPSTLHPSREGLVRSSPPVAHVGIPGSSTVPSAGGRYPLTLDVADAVTVGSFGGAELTQFGRIADGIHIADRLLVSDSYFREVRVFRANGDPLYRVGGPGPGPGEFLVPTSIDVDSLGRLIVFDGRGGVTAFATLRTQASPELVFTFRGEVAGGCVMNGDYYVHGFLPGATEVLHRFDSAGLLLASFAEVYRAQNRVVLQQVSLGRIACLPAGQLVLLAPGMLPELRAYSQAGDMVWWLLFDGFTPAELIEIPNGSKLRVRCAGYHSVESLVPIRGGTEALLQVAHWMPACSGQPKAETLHSYLIRGAPVRVEYIGSRLPRVLHWDDSYVLMHEAEPFPSVTLVPVGGGPL